ncbi:helix-turn-helix domain-containing protein [Mediterraneibacter gnavus]|uniref:Stage 0 sporulation protein A homolog n=2 Tax=Mediterraneibacter gnavus TaxID=33038 RepID=A0A414SAV4_MEDGN|nr:helix-turn-helix domain-containing protein [Mediterraneibacter gnavus]
MKEENLERNLMEKTTEKGNTKMREYSLLMVDDELFAVRGITEGISWEEFGITKVYGVCNVKEAKTILERERIDVVISDIEMPGENGLDLLTWVSENCPGTKMLLLTAYARFDYAAYALRYQAEDYLLKPVVHEELKQRVKQCLEKIQEEEQTEEELESLRLTVPLLVEKFWTDILEGRKVAYSRQIKELRKYVMLPIFAEERVTPILMAADTEAGMMELEACSRNVLQQIQQEQIGVFGRMTGIVWEEMLLFFVCKECSAEDVQQLEEKIRKIMDRQQFSFQMYIGRAVLLHEVPAVCESLMIRADQSAENRTALYPEGEEHAEDTVEQFPQIVDWIPMLERGKEAEFSAQMEELFEVLELNKITGRKELRELYMGLWYSFASASRRNSLEGILSGFTGSQRKVYRTLEELKDWTEKIKDRYFQELKKNEKKNFEVMEKVEHYVMEHISEDFKREDIANALYFNPSYLSHIFKAETGISLNKFINQLRIKEAKRLFDTTNLSVGTVAMDTGYYNFSYFSKQFKEIYHMTPSEYKKTSGNG